MASLPVLSGQEFIRAFESFGWTVARRRGRHIVMTKEGELVTLSVPDHKEVARGTFAKFNPRRQSNSRCVYRSHLKIVLDGSAMT